MRIDKSSIGEEGTTISVSLIADKVFVGNLRATFVYPGVIRPASEKQEYYKNDVGDIIGFNLKPALGVNDIYLVIVDHGLVVIPGAQELLQAALQPGQNIEKDSLYLTKIDGRVLEVEYEPWHKVASKMRFLLQSGTKAAVLK